MACEACWDQAFIESRYLTGEGQAVAYRRLLIENEGKPGHEVNRPVEPRPPKAPGMPIAPYKPVEADLRALRRAGDLLEEYADAKAELYEEEGIL